MSSELLADIQKRLRAFADAREWDQFHSPKNLSMALAVEASELLENFQWLTEEQSHSLDSAAMKRVTEEAADVLIYLLRFADKLDLDLLRAVEEKIKVNESKYPAEKVRGDSRKYSEYD